MTGPVPSAHDGRPPDLPTAWLRLAALLIWATGLLLLSLLPGVRSPGAAFDWDKLNHFGAYAVLTVLLGRLFVGIRGASSSGWPLWLSAALAASGFGALVELLQGAMQTGRSAEWGDLLANSLGAFAASVIFCLLGRRCSRTEAGAISHDR